MEKHTSRHGPAVSLAHAKLSSASTLPNTNAAPANAGAMSPHKRTDLVIRRNIAAWLKHYQDELEASGIDVTDRALERRMQVSGGTINRVRSLERIGLDTFVAIVRQLRVSADHVLFEPPPKARKRDKESQTIGTVGQDPSPSDG